MPRLYHLLKDTEAKYSKKISELARTQKHISLDSLYQIVEHPVKNDYTVFQWFQALIDEFKSLGKTGQVRVYQDAQRTLKSFLNDKDIVFDEIDLPFLYRYERFLNQRKIKVSTFSIYMRTFRAAIARAVKLGYTKEFAFNEYKIPTGKPNKRALSVEDMKALLKLKEKNDNFRYLVFSYYTVGMNFTDLSRLTWDNIRGNEITYTRQKIHHRMTIPIHQKVKVILDYYKPLTGNNPNISGLNENYIFPILNREIHKTEQQIAYRIQKKRKQFNDYLKIVGTKAKVDVSLTSYIFRHTAITHLVRRGVTADAIQALAGHKRLTTTENYIKESSNEQKTKAVNML